MSKSNFTLTVCRHKKKRKPVYTKKTRNRKITYRLIKETHTVFLRSAGARSTVLAEEGGENHSGVAPEYHN